MFNRWEAKKAAEGPGDHPTPLALDKLLLFGVGLYEYRMFLVALCHIQLLDRQEFNKKWPVRCPLQKRKKNLYRHSCRPCRVSDAREQPHWDSPGRICCVVEREPFFKYTGFSFHDFADSHVVIPMGLVTPSPTHRLLGMTRVKSKVLLALHNGFQAKVIDSPGSRQIYRDHRHYY